MNVQVVSRSGKVIEANLEVTSRSGGEPTLADLKRAFHAEKKPMYPERQRWTYDGKVLDKDATTLAGYGVPASGAKLVFKDLGPQIGWRTVFMLEYLGPLLIYPFFWHLDTLIYGEPVERNRTQRIAYMMLMAHFLKREYETVFVHRFSHGTMPLSNLFKNSFHYWVLSGVLIAWRVFAPNGAPEHSDAYIAACVALYAFGQMSNYMTHAILRDLRPPGSTARKIPYGYGFNLVSCPNYFFEAVSWTAVLLLTQSWATLVFIIFAVGQMYLWAVKKHKAYKKEFPNYPKNRKAMFPFIA
ncbi:3-oxo-5a-steroid 4- dehydrogenase [Allomyces javanicus]|nr:3-oxo-5a-steroid 4- dehydrogenase [Allomyces javanicus]